MQLKTIRIENFKAIQGPAAIDIKPITLLFGPNSAGKSTIIQALHYAREIIERENIDPDQTAIGGALDLGGFQQLVHGHNLDKPIRLGFRFVVESISLPEFTFMNPNNVTAGIEEKLEETDEILFDVTIEAAWSHLLGVPTVTSYDLTINDQFLAIIQASKDARQIQLTKVNYSHDLLREPEEDDQDGDSPFHDDFGEPSVYHTEEPAHEYRDEFDQEDQVETLSYLSHDSHFEYRDQVDDGSYDPGPYENASPQDSSAFSIVTPNVGVYGQNSSLPPLNRPVELAEEDADKLLFSERICQLLSASRWCLNEVLGNFLYLGPIREVPPRNYRPIKSPDSSRWSNGLAAWDLLFTSDRPFIEQANSWLARKDRLDAGYKIDQFVYKELNVNGPLMFALRQGRALDDDWVTKELDLLPTQRRVSLREYRGGIEGIEVLPQDIGVGISQVLPVVVASLYSHSAIGSLIAIEQPELHVHPALQVALGDLFISEAVGMDGDKTFLLETHSEHLLLRLLRRIRETTNGDNNGGVDFYSDNLGIYFIEPGDETTVIARIDVDEDGEFMDQWPRGFFEERAKELF